MSAESSAKAQSGSMIGIAVISRQTSILSRQATGVARCVVSPTDSVLPPVRLICSATYHSAVPVTQLPSHLYRLSDGVACNPVSRPPQLRLLVSLEVLVELVTDDI